MAHPFLSDNSLRSGGPQPLSPAQQALASGPVTTPDELKADLNRSDNPLTKGLRSGFTSLGANANEYAGTVGQALGLTDFANSRFAEADDFAKKADEQGPDVRDIRSAKDFNTAAQFVLGIAGQAIASTTPAIALGTAGALRYGLRASLPGAYLGSFLPEAGQQAGTLRKDPQLAGQSAAARLANASADASIVAALDTYTPARVIGRGAGQVAGHLLKDVAIEGGTEGLQDVVGQGFHKLANPDVQYDPNSTINSAIGGVIGGGALHAGGAVVGAVPHLVRQSAGVVGKGIDAVSPDRTPQALNDDARSKIDADVASGNIDGIREGLGQQSAPLDPDGFPDIPDHIDTPEGVSEALRGHEDKATEGLKGYYEKIKDSPLGKKLADYAENPESRAALYADATKAYNESAFGKQVTSLTAELQGFLNKDKAPEDVKENRQLTKRDHESFDIVRSEMKPEYAAGLTSQQLLDHVVAMRDYVENGLPERAVSDKLFDYYGVDGAQDVLQRLSDHLGKTFKGDALKSAIAGRKERYGKAEQIVVANLRPELIPHPAVRKEVIRITTDRLLNYLDSGKHDAEFEKNLYTAFGDKADSVLEQLDAQREKTRLVNDAAFQAQRTKPVLDQEEHAPSELDVLTKPEVAPGLNDPRIGRRVGYDQALQDIEALRKEHGRAIDFRLIKGKDRLHEISATPAAGDESGFSDDTYSRIRENPKYNKSGLENGVLTVNLADGRKNKINLHSLVVEMGKRYGRDTDAGGARRALDLFSRGISQLVSDPKIKQDNPFATELKKNKDGTFAFPDSTPIVRDKNGEVAYTYGDLRKAQFGQSKTAEKLRQAIRDSKPNTTAEKAAKKARRALGDPRSFTERDKAIANLNDYYKKQQVDRQFAEDLEEQALAFKSEPDPKDRLSVLERDAADGDAIEEHGLPLLNDALAQEQATIDEAEANGKKDGRAMRVKKYLEVSITRVEREVESLRQGTSRAFEQSGVVNDERAGNTLKEQDPKKPRYVQEETGELLGEPVGKGAAAGAASRLDLSASTRKSPYFAKDQAKAQKANKFIGRGSFASSTNAYRIAVGDRANTGKYSSGDRVFISAEGARSGRVEPDFAEIKRATDAGATIITDDKANRSRGFNEGERAVAVFLGEQGYKESAPGEWIKNTGVGAASDRFGIEQRLPEPIKARMVKIVRDTIGHVVDVVFSKEIGIQSANFDFNKAGRPIITFFENLVQAGEGPLFAHHEAAHAVVTVLYQTHGKELAKRVVSLANKEYIRRQVESATGITSGYFLGNPEELFVHSYALWADGKLQLKEEPVLARVFDRIKELFGKLTDNKLIAEVFGAIKAGEGKDLVTGLDEFKFRERIKSKDFFSYGSAEAPTAQEVTALKNRLGKLADSVIGDKLNIGQYNFLRSMAESPSLRRRFAQTSEVIREILPELGDRGGVGAAVSDVRYNLQGKDAPLTDEQRARVDQIVSKENYDGLDTVQKGLSFLRAARKRYDEIVAKMGEMNRLFDAGKEEEAEAFSLTEDDKDARYSLEEWFKPQSSFDIHSFVDEAPDFRSLPKEQQAKALAIVDGLQGKKANLQGKGGASIDPEAEAKIRAFVEKTLGKDAAVLFKEMEASGSFAKLSGVETLTIAVDALDPQSIAHHEALHALFARIIAADKKSATELANAASSPTVRARLRELLKDEPAALEQLKDPEERLAYMYQFWQAGKLEIGPKTQNWFEKVTAFYRRITGALSDAEKAENIFKAFSDGRLADRNTVAKVLEQLNPESRVERLTKLAPGVFRWAERAISTADGYIRAIGNPAFTEVSEKFYTPINNPEGKEPGYLQTKHVELNRRTNELARLLRGADEKDIASVLESLQKGERPDSDNLGARKAYTGIRVMLDQFYKYLDAAGVKNVTKDGNKDLGFVKNFFPVVYDSEKINNESAAFVKDLTDNGVPEAVAKATLSKVIRDVESTDIKENDFHTGLTYFNPSTKERTLVEIPAEVLAKWQSKNLVGTLSTYFARGVRRAEYTRRFGNSGEGIESAIDSARKIGATDQQVSDFRRTVQALEGSLGQNINPKLRAAFGALTTYQNVRLLPLALFSSLVDPLGIAVRGGTAGEAFGAFTRGIRELVKLNQDYKYDLATTIGAIDDANARNAVSDAYGSHYMSGLNKKINDSFFKWTGQESWNRSIRTSAAAAAEQFIIRHTEKPGEHSARYLTELGLMPEDAVIKNGHLELNDKTVKALNLWVDGAVLRPSAAIRPVWASDPHWMLVSHLKQFTYSFQKTILERVIHEADHGNFRSLGVLSTYVPFIVAADILKVALTPTQDDDKTRAGWGLSQWLWSGVQRAGLFGPGQYAVDSASDMGRGKFGIESLAGPTAEQLLNFGQAAASPKPGDLSKWFGKAIPGYKQLITTSGNKPIEKDSGANSAVATVVNLIDDV